LRLPIEQVRGRNGGPEDTVRRIHWTKYDQSIGAGVWQRTDQHHVTDAEDRRIYPDTNGEAYHGDDGCHAAMSDRPKRVPDIGWKPAHRI
jgi:hypothetical protein